MTRSSFAVTAGFVGMLAAGTTALKVTQPSLGMSVVANSLYPIEWSGVSDDARFEIDLTYCGSYSYCFDDEGDCGFLVENLCTNGDQGCGSDADGAYEALMPEPLDGVSSNGYRVRLAQVGYGSERIRCSEDFYLVSSQDVPLPGNTGGPSMAVVSPTADSIAVAGNEYTIEFDYDNGFGSTVGRFKIDMYAQSEVEDMMMGDCGFWISSVCDKPDIGCKDSTGDYDVVLPQTTSPGFYKIRVGLFGDDAVYACSEAFEIVEMGDDLWA